MIRRFLAKLLAAFAIHPAFRGATVPGNEKLPPKVNQDDRFDESEVDIGGGASWHNRGENYAGLRASVQEQVAATANGNGYRAVVNGREIRFGMNSCLGGARAEFEQFVKDRTHD